MARARRKVAADKSVIYAVLTDGGTVENLVALGADVRSPANWVPVGARIDVQPGWSTPDGGKTWVAGEPPPARIVPTSDEIASAVQTVQSSLDPNVSNPSLEDQVQALTVIVASTSPLTSGSN